MHEQQRRKKQHEKLKNLEIRAKVKKKKCKKLNSKIFKKDLDLHSKKKKKKKKHTFRGGFKRSA